MTTQPAETDHSPNAPWWRSHRAWWIAGIAVLLAMLIGFIIEEAGRPALTPYGGFLDQLDADNIAAVTFRGMEIGGRFRRPIVSATSSGTIANDAFSSRVPDFGDPTLIPELRKHHVVIDVVAASRWTSLLAGLPWPMLLFLGAAAIAALVRLARGGKAQSQSITTAHPMQAILAYVSRLFAKPPPAAKSVAGEDNEPKSS